jgi:uncharacterized protein (DUF58 family)
MKSPRRWLADWFENRLPASDTWLLTQRNIYIVPTGAGLGFALTLVLMLLASINYQLNLGYVLTFLLAGSALVSMHLTHRNLRGLSLHLRPPQPGFAGEPALLDIVIGNPGATRHGLALRFTHRPHETTTAAAAGNPADTAWCDVPAQGEHHAQLATVPGRRGWQTLPALHLETRFPFGLFRAWTVWRPASRLLAWPRPEQPATPLPHAQPAPGEQQRAQPGLGSELDGVRPWRRGDSMRQVAWKKVARSGEMVSRETAAASGRELWLDWQTAQAPDTEARLSRLAAWVLAADRQGLVHGLRLPGRELPPGQGEAHRREALDALALWT